MGTVTTTIYTKQAATLTVAHFVANGNAIFDAIAASGMVQVGHDVAPGQCNRLVAVATADPLDAVVEIKSSTWSANANRHSKGFKIFRHPQLGFYLRVDILEIGASSATYTALGIQFQYASELTPEGALNSPLTVYPRGGGANGWTPGSTSYPAGKELTLRVSTGKDHFVLGHTFDMGSYEYSSAISSGDNWSGYCMNPRGGYSTLSFVVVQTSDPKYHILMVPRTMENNTSYPQEYAINNYQSYDTGLQRRWLVDTTTGSATYLGGNQCVSGMPEPGTVSDKYGIRVAQLTLTVNGELLSLPLGTVHGGAVADMGLLTVDLDGNGPRQFFCSYGFGPTTFVPSRYLVANTPYLLIPYGD